MKVKRTPVIGIAIKVTQLSGGKQVKGLPAQHITIHGTTTDETMRRIKAMLDVWEKEKGSDD